MSLHFQTKNMYQDLSHCGLSVYVFNCTLIFTFQKDFFLVTTTTTLDPTIKTGFYLRQSQGSEQRVDQIRCSSRMFIENR